ncbi:Protein RTM1 [Penicillium verhagenii]|uniref:Protein RTM1 n=1 Tax=Penicillium verhagenii TaxID=1562060 RepID=UPI0025456348|nr:Protein RTM1 [Penicillium verhagenii]KAJ5934275.1 Protein RTM1 [Penicillium verhagenii]
MSATTSDGGIDFALYRYTPSLPAAVVFAVIFLLLSIFHLIRLFKNRTYLFIPFIVGLLFECAGYIARIFSHFDTLALGPYIVQTMLILVAPPLFAASIYMTLGRIIVRLGAEDKSIVPIRFLTKIFVVGDVISFFMQCGGGGYMAAGTISAMKIGADVVVGGLVVQLLFFGFFVIVSAVFHWRVKKQKRTYMQVSSSQSQGPETRMTWEAVMWALYGACLLILVRSVFRVVEFIEGNDGFIMRREYLLYIFDACLMSLTGILFLIVYPGSFLPKGGKRDSELQLMSS